MTDKEKLEAVFKAIRNMKCPGRHGGFDKCQESGCYGGGSYCSLHALLDPEMVDAKADRLDRAKDRNLEHLRAENKVLRDRLEKIETLVTEPVEVPKTA